MLSDNSGELSFNEISNIIGSDYFRDEIIRTYLKKGMNDIDKREQPALARLNSLSVDDVIRVVGEYFKLENTDRVVVRKGAILDARKIAMHLAVRHCKRTDSLARIASHFGVGINGISSNTKRCDEKLLTNKVFRKQLQEIDGKTTPLLLVHLIYPQHPAIFQPVWKSKFLSVYGNVGDDLSLPAGFRSTRI